VCKQILKFVAYFHERKLQFGLLGIEELISQYIHQCLLNYLLNYSMAQKLFESWLSLRL